MRAHITIDRHRLAAFCRRHRIRKLSLFDSVLLELETNEGMVSFLLNVHKYGLGLDYMQRYPDLVGAVTRPMIQETVARYFRPERYVLALAGTLEG